MVSTRLGHLSQSMKEKMKGKQFPEIREADDDYRDYVGEWWDENNDLENQALNTDYITRY